MNDCADDAGQCRKEYGCRYVIGNHRRNRHSPQMIYVNEEYRQDAKPVEYAKSFTYGDDEGYCKKERGVGAEFSEKYKIALRIT